MVKGLHLGTGRLQKLDFEVWMDTHIFHNFYLLNQVEIASSTFVCLLNQGPFLRKR